MNKTLLTVAQVFIGIIAVILLIYALILIIIFNIADIALPTIFIAIVFFIIIAFYTVIFIRFGKAKTDPAMKTEVIVWSVLLIITSNLIAGLLGLIGALSEPSPNSQIQGQSLEQRLKALDDLYDRGLITLDEYHERRKRIIQLI